MATAFGTDSSNATLPITMRCATEGLGCDPRIVQFFLPLGEHCCLLFVVVDIF